MNYTKESIAKRKYIAGITRQIIKKAIYILLIVYIYNSFLITKSSLDDNGSKEMFGYKAYIITTESMRPSIKEGDVIIVEKCIEEKLKIGDIITSNKEGEIITHRIVDIQENEQNEYITKGDNNNVQDSEVIVYDEIEGKKVLVIPLLGNIILLLRNKIYIILLILVIILIGLNVINSQKKKKMRREKKKIEDEKYKEGRKSEIKQDS